MFEQYIRDWLTSYLGHFLDIKRENLRANILSGEITLAGFPAGSPALRTPLSTVFWCSLF